MCVVWQTFKIIRLCWISMECDPGKKYGLDRPSSSCYYILPLPHVHIQSILSAINASTLQPFILGNTYFVKHLEYRIRCYREWALCIRVMCVIFVLNTILYYCYVAIIYYRNNIWNGKPLQKLNKYI